MTWTIFGQTTPTPAGRYRVFTSDGTPATLNDIAAALDKYEVICLGETHDDPAAHEVEAELYKLAIERFTKGDAQRPLALSLEMFERDTQVVVDEYLAGLINENHFMQSSRPWKNYPTDYRPLIELAKANHLMVLAANAPGRYVNMVSRLGRDSLKNLSPQAKAWLPPLPFPTSSMAYSNKFNALMGASVPTGMAGAPSHGGNGLLDAQTLRDAAMGQAIAEQLKKQAKAFVFHVNGNFHSEEKLGVPEQIQHYRPNTKTLVVTVAPADSFPNFDPSLGKLGDYVIVSDKKVPRTF